MGASRADPHLEQGEPFDTATTDQSTRAIRELNDWAAGDARVETVLLPVADGLTLVRKRVAGEAT